MKKSIFSYWFFDRVRSSDRIVDGQFLHTEVNLRRAWVPSIPGSGFFGVHRDKLVAIAWDADNKVFSRPLSLEKAIARAASPDYNIHRRTGFLHALRRHIDSADKVVDRRNQVQSIGGIPCDDLTRHLRHIADIRDTEGMNEKVIIAAHNLLVRAHENGLDVRPPPERILAMIPARQAAA